MTYNASPGAQGTTGVGWCKSSLDFIFIHYLSPADQGTLSLAGFERELRVTSVYICIRCTVQAKKHFVGKVDEGR